LIMDEEVKEAGPIMIREVNEEVEDLDESDE
jgi:hypothetical protein